MTHQWLRREDPPWSDELYAFIIRSRIPGTVALVAVVLATVDVRSALPWLLVFLAGIVVVNTWTFRRAVSHREMPEAVGLLEMVGPVLLGFWIPGLLYAALLMSVTSVVFARLIYGPRITIIGMVIAVAIASYQQYLDPVPFAAVTIGVYLVTGLRLVAALDVLARREFTLSDRLRERAERDHLTGLANRPAFVDRLEERLAQIEARQEGGVRLLYIDVDSFKAVNDTLGHHHGDLFLTEVARRLVAVAPGAVVARIGGDEFALLLDEDPEGSAAATSARIHAALEPPIVVGAFELRASVSIGEAIGPQHGATVVELINSADLAMYDAKTVHGRSRLFSPDLAAGHGDTGRGAARVVRPRLRPGAAATPLFEDPAAPSTAAS